MATSKQSVEQLTTGLAWHHPNPLQVLETIDQISSDCCEVVDSTTILYRAFVSGASQEDGLSETLNDAVIASNTQISEFLNSEYLNLNQKLLCLLH